MSRVRGGGRTQACSKEQARQRLGHAGKFLDVAKLAAGETGDLEYASTAAALGVLAGIAAADAACCAAFGRRSRGQDHQHASKLIEQVEPGGPQAANALRRLLSLKDEAHYGFFDVGGRDLQAAIRQAEALVDFAAAAVQRAPG
jgi:hypothetical protein